jgi:hypothetical protein
VFQVVASAAGAALVMVSSVVEAAGGTSTDLSVARSALMRSVNQVTSRSTDSMEWRRSSDR